MNEFLQTIKESFQLLELEDNWDDEDSLKVKEEVFASSLKLLMELFIEVKNIPIPEINLCPDGSIDIGIRTLVFRLLINVKENYIGWYGDHYNDINQTKHTKHTVNELIIWLKDIIK